MSEETENNNIPEGIDEQFNLVYDALYDAIPDKICSFVVLLALQQLAFDWTMNLHEEVCELTDEDDDISPVGNVPGTPFSKN